MNCRLIGWSTKVIFKKILIKNKNMYCKLLRKFNGAIAIFVAVLLSGGISVIVFASDTSNFTQTINAGSLSTDIVDGSWATVGSPSVAMSAKTFSFSCLTGGSASTGTFGTTTQRLYVQNPDASDTGWILNMNGSATTAFWDGTAGDFDFNDPTSSGCADGDAAVDADSLAGQMTVDPSGASLNVGQCASCVVTNVSLGTSEAFDETAASPNEDIDLMTGAGTSDDIGDWYLGNPNGVSISQTIPAETPADTDYDINMDLDIVAT